MFATSDRVRPCSARWLGSSDGRVTVSVPLSCDSAMSGGSVRESSPFGPFTVTRLPSIVTVTPLGTWIGSLPIRDIVRWPPLPDQGEELAAGAALARLLVGEQPLRGAQDRHAQAVAHARDLAHADVLAQPRRRDAVQ